MAFTGTIVDGTVDTEDILDLDEAVDVDPDVAILEDDESRFTKFLMTPGLKKRTTFSIKPQWLESELLPRTSALIAGPTYTAINTDFKVTAGQWNRFRRNDVIKNETTNEFSVVTAINSSTDTLTVIRAVGSTAGTPAAGHVIFIVSNAFAQGADIGDFRVTKKVGVYNYTQIFRHGFSFTRTMKGQKYYSGDPVAYETRLQMLYHRRAMEHQFTVGGRDLLAQTATDGPRGLAGGLFYYITTNVTLSMATFIESAWETFARTAFQYDAGTKVAMICPRAATILNSFPASKISVDTTNPQSDITRWGVVLKDYMTGLGDHLKLSLMRHWGNGDFATTNKSLGGAVIIINPERISMRTLTNGQTKLMPDRQGNGVDRIDLEYLTECSLQVKQEREHAIGLNVA